MMTIVFGTVLPWLLIAVGTWLGLQLARQNGRILLRLEGIEKRLTPRADGKMRDSQSREPAGLSIGTQAPEFELPDLAGVRHKLADFRHKELLLIFFNPQCGFCTKIIADLARLPVQGDADHAVPIIVTTGDAGANRKLVEKAGLHCLVLLQPEMEVASAYRAQGTPMGYRIDGAGRIASDLAIGGEPLLKLAKLSSLPPPAARHTPPVTEPPGKDYRSLAGSRLNRSGLKASLPAPEFRLPLLEGGELALADFRGRRVLLVFSDPDCGPCDELAPRLEQLHAQRSDLQVLVVSRREVELNRMKATKLGLTFPIVLQQKWEVSLKYAMFATPVGYLIDEQGILASDAAVGVGPILALVGESLSESSAAAPSPRKDEEVAMAQS
jgi:peroxiredoxin